MVKKRLTAVLIIRDGQVVQSIKFKHTNVIHYDATHAMEAFNKWSVDEIVLLNVSRDPESQSHFANVVLNVSRHCFVPLTAGGWITNVDYAQLLLRNGADKLCLNTALAEEPSLVESLARRYGRQCIVISIDVKRVEDRVQVVVDRGRTLTGIDPIEWATKAQKIGAGEILFNSIDHDGFRKGYDLETLKSICQAVDIPVIAFGGVSKWHHLVEGIDAGAGAVAAANIFHYTEQSTKHAKAFLAQSGINVRKEGQINSED